MDTWMYFTGRMPMGAHDAAATSCTYLQLFLMPASNDFSLLVLASQNDRREGII